VETHRIPLFPLASVVLFPRTSVPLHIFEPRYRRMVESALETDRRLAMVTVRPEHAGEMQGDPPIYPVGCAGFIRSYQRLADGRYNLLLAGSHRVRIEGELPRAGDRPFRIGEVSPLEDPVRDASLCAQLRAQVVSHLEKIVSETAGLSLEQLVGTTQHVDVARFTDGVCQTLALPVAEKQSLLDADSIDERLARLEGALAFHLAMAEQGASRQPGSETLH